MYRITKAWAFSAAHHLPLMPEGHQCKRVHGHNYRVTLVLEADVLDPAGMVIDYGELSLFGAVLRDTFDHRDLNDMLSQPTAENLAAFLYGVAWQMWPDKLGAVQVQETDGTSAEYRP
jgi:6-pyruvoyltetrahydropterin/6-carboxytetrahydropterin synthase